MKAVIVDLHGKRAAVLDESGNILRIRNESYELGQSIELHRTAAAKTPRLLKQAGSIAAAAVVTLSLGIGTAYAVPCGTVTLEGETSIEYTINCFDRVLEVQAVGADGSSVVSGLDLGGLRHSRIEDAVTETADMLAGSGGCAELTVSADTYSGSHSRRLCRELDAALNPVGQSSSAGFAEPSAAEAQLPAAPDRSGTGDAAAEHRPEHGEEILPRSSDQEGRPDGAQAEDPLPSSAPSPAPEDAGGITDGAPQESALAPGE